MKLEITPAQLKTIMDLTDDISAMTGCSDEEQNNKWTKDVRLVDRMLKKNGYKRQYT